MIETSILEILINQQTIISFIAASGGARINLHWGQNNFMGSKFIIKWGQNNFSLTKTKKV